MAKQITELTAAGGITKATDLLWLEQGGLPFKLTLTALEAAITPTPAAHTHPASDVVSGVMAPARLGSANFTHTQTYNWIGYDRVDSTDLDTYIGTGHYGTDSSNTNGPTGTFDTLALFRNSDVGTQLMLPRNGSALDTLAYRGWSSSGAALEAWRYTGWATTNALADLALYGPLASPVFTGTVTAPQITSGVDVTQPWLTLDSTGAGDNWDAQGAGISVGENGKKGAAAMHMTYNGDGSGYIGMGAVDDTTSTGGRPAFGHIDFTYNDYDIKFGGKIFPGSTTGTPQTVGYIDTPTLRGSINVTGQQVGSYSGYSISNRVMFMDNGTTFGVYDEVQDEWKWNSTTALAYISLWNGGVEEARTNNSNASGNQSGLVTNDYDQNMRDVGFADMNEDITFTANLVVSASHWHKCLTHTNATTHTLTFNTLTTVPNGAVLWVKARTGIVTITEGTMTMTLYAGAALTTGDISVAIGGWATVHKTGNSAADVTGVGLT